MTDTATLDPQPPKARPTAVRRFMEFLVRPWTLVVAGGLTLLVAAATLTGWIFLHEAMWAADWKCAASLSIRPAEGRLFTVLGVTPLLTLTGATLWLAFRRSRRVVAGSVFWMSASTLWIVGAVMASATYTGLECGRLL